MTARLSPQEREDDSRRSYDLWVAVSREICIRKHIIYPEVGNKLQQQWWDEGEVPSSHLHCVREERLA